MGLDMYLFSGTADDARRRADEPFSDASYARWKAAQVAYWRKANQIHHWFVTNVQGGVDDCGYYDVDREQLAGLLQTVNETLAAVVTAPGLVKNGAHAGPETGGKWVDDFEAGERIVNPEEAEKRLPTAAGCFFGSTDYDSFYVEDLRDTKAQLEAALAGPEPAFTYHSSW